MTRPLRELIKDHEADPTPWHVVRTEVVPSTVRRNRGGSSVQELLRHNVTGEEMVRHTLLKPDGTVFEDAHFRRAWK
ncbi:MAG TPA: hypothetical protein VG013_11225 [Gemmataceae bacterium]|jgi:hypothetical protein|nr:hypothetical protein [Gemmataceae bacterium]